MQKEKMGGVYGAALLYTIITGLSFIFGKIALEGAPPLDLLAHRFSASFIVVLILLLLGRVKLKFTFKQLLKILPLAILYPLLFFAFQTYGLQAATAIEAGILTATIPIFTLIMATLFLKEKTNIYQIGSIVASVAGVIYITLKKSSSVEVSSVRGIILILLSTLACRHSVLARILTRSSPRSTLALVMIIISFVTFNAVAVTKHAVRNPPLFWKPLKDFKFVISVLYLGILSTLVTSFLTNFVLSKLEASKMSVFANLGTIVTIIASVIILKETLYYYHILGSVLIIGGVLGTNFLDRRSP